MTLLVGCLVVPKFLGVEYCVEQQKSALVIPHLAFGEHHHDGTAFTVAHGVEPGAQAGLGAPDTTHRSPFLITKIIVDTISQPSFRGIQRDRGGNSSIRRICASLSKYG